MWIATDGTARKLGIGATLYITRAGKFHVAGFFSAKLCGSQHSRLPCEVEAMSIAVAAKNFSPYLIQSAHNACTCILTGSKPWSRTLRSNVVLSFLPVPECLHSCQQSAAIRYLSDTYLGQPSCPLIFPAAIPPITSTLRARYVPL